MPTARAPSRLLPLQTEYNHTKMYLVQYIPEETNNMTNKIIQKP
jgi:hypothetical protein